MPHGRVYVLTVDVRESAHNRAGPADTRPADRSPRSMQPTRVPEPRTPRPRIRASPTRGGASDSEHPGPGCFGSSRPRIRDGCLGSETAGSHGHARSSRAPAPLLGVSVARYRDALAMRAYAASTGILANADLSGSTARCAYPFRGPATSAASAPPCSGCRPRARPTADLPAGILRAAGGPVRARAVS